MRNSIFYAILLIATIIFPTTTFAYTVILSETARGEYENGKFSKGKPEFKFRIEIDEVSKKALLTETTRLKNNTLIDTNIEYRIIILENAPTISSLLRSKNKIGQKVMTLVGMPGSKAIEVIVIGEGFFEYSKVASSRFYLASGTVQKAIPLSDDSLKQVLPK